MKKVDGLMQAAVANGVFSGSALLVARDDCIVFNEAYGKISNDSSTAVTSETVFDLASLTKPLVTAPAVMQLVSQKTISLDTKITDVLPSFTGDGKNQISVANLLCHNSGLPDYRPYYTKLRDLHENDREAALKNMVFNEPLVNPPGAKVVYSDLGFMLLAWAVEALSGRPLDRYIYENVYQPLQIKDLFFNRGNLPVKDERIYAATEDCPWRKMIVSGSVHDDNAWVAGGVCGHAGLFGTIGGVYRMLSKYLQWYNGSIKNNLFPPEILKLFLTEYGKTGRTPGFDMPSEKNSSSGSLLSKKSVGHLGFTGTSFWIDLERKIIIILLSNRVHPSRENVQIRKFRPEIHNCIMRLLLNKTKTMS